MQTKHLHLEGPQHLLQRSRTMSPNPLFDGITALFYRTPQEHLNGMWKIIKKLPPSPPPRYVRTLCPWDTWLQLSAHVHFSTRTYFIPVLVSHTQIYARTRARRTSQIDTSAYTCTSDGNPDATKPSLSCAIARSWATFRSTDLGVYRSPASTPSGRSMVVR